MTTTTANPGAETPFPSVPNDAGSMEGERGHSDYAPYERESDVPADHDPEAKALLRRYLSEVHSYREMGNHALRSLEARLATLPPKAVTARPAAHDAGSPGEERGGYASRLMTPSLPAAGQARAGRSEPGLQQRLSELSAYLHADLSKEDPGHREPPRPVPPRRAPPRDPAEHNPSGHKIPSLPVLDRSWFEERFAALRGSMDQVVEQVPLKRLERLEAQFRDLMERLTAREAARDPRPLEASLKKLATYLSDSRQWAAANEKRVKGVEDKLDRLSKLVAQSHAAISATAKGLEIVAQGTGEKLARKTADIVVARMGEKVGEKLAERIDRLNPADRLDQLGREVAHLSAQSRHIARNTDERLEQIQIVLRESNKVFPRPPVAPAERAAPQTAQKAASDGSPHDELESYLNQPIDPDDDYDSDMIAAAQRAARLADGSDQNASAQNAPVRYQIPYGEFLPDEYGPASRTGLIIAMVILMAAGATMLVLKMKEWTLVEPKAAVSLEERYRQAVSTASKQAKLAAPQAAEAQAVQPQENTAAIAVAGSAAVPVVTGSTPAAPALGSKPLQLWVAASKPAEQEMAPAKPREASIPQWETSFREAAVKGDANAQFSVGQSYLSGENGEADLSRAARWFRRAAEGGHAPSQYRIATLYELGHGTPRDLVEAEKWYERAASQGHVKAMHNLAVLALSPNARTANFLTAARWFKQAASYGLVDSQFNLGVLYERGLGLQKDPVEAYRWFALAARQKDQKALQKRDEMSGLLTDSERLRADRLVTEWRAKPRNEVVNQRAAEPPTTADAGEKEKKPSAPRTAEMPTAALMRASWTTDVAPVRRPTGTTAMVLEAQRLLKQRGYDPGPIDGIPGKRTQEAIRSFQRKSGLAATGDVTESLIVKMAFLPL